MSVEFDVEARMRDGTVLRANVYRPDAGGPWPTLLSRTPYSKDNPAIRSWLDPETAARNGFMVVVQDTRGRFSSSGEWSPFAYEADDGYDSVQWAAGLPGSNGHVAMFGASYMGNAQWLAAIECPPALAAIVPGLTWCDPEDGLYSRGGAIEWGLALNWAMETGVHHIARSPATADTDVHRLLDAHDDLPHSRYWDLPVGAKSALAEHGLVDIGSLSIRTRQRLGEVPRVKGRHEKVRVPTYNIGGWYDPFIQGTIDNHVAMTRMQHGSKLLIGPWTHMDTGSGVVGDVNHGVRSGRSGFIDGGLTRLHLDWLHPHLVAEADRERSDIRNDKTSVRVFTLGVNRWRDEDSWPPARMREDRWYLREGGRLTRRSPEAGETPTRFMYDPAEPVPTNGGPIIAHPYYRAGPIDQKPIEERSDVRIFTSPPLERDIEVSGRVRASLNVVSSAPATDWVVRLCDVDDSGVSTNICDGIVRVMDRADDLQARQVDMWSTSVVFRRGHRVRVQVTSSCFPRWDRNLNTGDQDRSGTLRAMQNIHHAANHPSYVVLPSAEEAAVSHTRG